MRVEYTARAPSYQRSKYRERVERTRQLFNPVRLATVADAQLAYIDEDLDRWFGDWPIELCRHSPVDGLSYWPIKKIQSWGELHDFLQTRGSQYLFSYKWSDRRRWRVLRVGWWTPDDVLARLANVVLPQRGIDWGAVAHMDARRDVLDKYPATGLRKYMGHCAAGNRSDVVYRIVRTLMERGASNEEAACVAAASEAYKSALR